jgi:hypothetical protein
MKWGGRAAAVVLSLWALNFGDRPDQPAHLLTADHLVDNQSVLSHM